jgi:hypothetical protein
MPWVAEHRLSKNGNGIAITIPRTFLHRLGWICGRAVILELNDDLTEVVVRLPRQSDFGVPGSPKVRRLDDSEQANPR